MESSIHIRCVFSKELPNKCNNLCPLLFNTQRRQTIGRKFRTRCSSAIEKLFTSAAFETAKLKPVLFHDKCLASVCDISKNKFHFGVAIACPCSERKKAKTKTKEAINTDQKKVSRTQNIWQNCSKSKNEPFVT